MARPSPPSPLPLGSLWPTWTMLLASAGGCASTAAAVTRRAARTRRRSMCALLAGLLQKLRNLQRMASEAGLGDGALEEEHLLNAHAHRGAAFPLRRQLHFARTLQFPV